MLIRGRIGVLFSREYTYKVNQEVKFMYRTMKVPFYASENTIQRLFDIRRKCGVIWNDCVQITRYYFRLGGRWITKTDLQKELKGFSSFTQPNRSSGSS